MTDDHDRKRTESDRSRSKKTERASDALARVLRSHGLPVPTRLDEILSTTTVVPVAVPTPTQHDRATHRRSRLDALKWPALALDHATDPSMTDAIDAIKAWDSSRRWVLVLSGGKGCGKTVACAWLALNDRNVAPFRFIRAATLVRVGRFGNELADALAAPSLCLDDLGSEYVDAKGSFVADLEEMIDTFYGDRRRLVITTNLGGVALEKRYGARIADRLTECAEWVALQGGSMRESSRHESEVPPWER